jgi:hypothetical protein
MKTSTARAEANSTTPQVKLSRKDKAVLKAQDDVNKAMEKLEQLKRRAEEAAQAAIEPRKKRGRPAGAATATGSGTSSG